MANSSELHEARGQILGQYPWDWFLTLTFREPVPSFTAHRRFARFVRDIEKAAGLPSPGSAPTSTVPQAAVFTSTR